MSDNSYEEAAGNLYHLLQDGNLDDFHHGVALFRARVEAKGGAFHQRRLFDLIKEYARTKIAEQAVAAIDNILAFYLVTKISQQGFDPETPLFDPNITIIDRYQMMFENAAALNGSVMYDVAAPFSQEKETPGSSIGAYPVISVSGCFEHSESGICLFVAETELHKPFLIFCCCPGRNELTGRAFPITSPQDLREIIMQGFPEEGDEIQFIFEGQLSHIAACTKRGTREMMSIELGHPDGREKSLVFDPPARREEDVRQQDFLAHLFPFLDQYLRDRK